MVNNHGTHAVWVGRFQPIHLGHVEILAQSLRVLELPHVVVLPYDFRGPKTGRVDEYLLAAQEAYRRDINPLTVWERTHLMALALTSLPDGRRVFPIAAPHHEDRPGVIDEFFPSDRLICVTDKDAFEGAKVEYWQHRGEEVFVLKTGTDVLTTTKLRDLVTAGAEWRDFMPPTTHAYFAAIDGPQRLFGISGR